MIKTVNCGNGGSVMSNEGTMNAELRNHKDFEVERGIERSVGFYARRW